MLESSILDVVDPPALLEDSTGPFAVPICRNIVRQKASKIFGRWLN
jgi:hypothetical protein